MGLHAWGLGGEGGLELRHDECDAILGAGGGRRGRGIGDLGAHGAHGRLGALGRGGAGEDVAQLGCGVLGLGLGCASDQQCDLDVAVVAGGQVERHEALLRAGGLGGGGADLAGDRGAGRGRGADGARLRQRAAGRAEDGRVGGHAVNGGLGVGGSQLLGRRRARARAAAR
ncbi:MAG: hypothetical protein J3K34DRAFT_408828, partial [Monoraphidium minutum]